MASEDEPIGAPRVEAFGLLAALAALGTWLVTRYSVSPISDPVQWFSFGRRFPAEFAERELAYGFPLVLWGAISAVGPYLGFLTNVPILLLVAAALAGFARECARDGERAIGPAGAALAGAVAFALFVSRDPTWIVHLANPYRDPLAFLCTLVSTILALRFVSGRGRSLPALAASGALLAFACSTRETSVLVLGPLLLFAVLARLRDRNLPFAKALAVFGVAFAIAAIPYLVQNQLVSGHALVPGQATDTFEESASVAPGIEAGAMAETLPAVLRHLADHYRIETFALAALGLLAAGLRRNLAFLALCVPAALAYVLFYGAYDRAVPRYLLVVDLFVLPVAGFGAGFALDAALARLRRPALLARLAVAAGFVLAVAASFHGRATTIEQRVTVEGVEGFVERAQELIPEDVLVLGGRPSIDVLATFLPNRTANVANLVGSRRLEDPALPEALRSLVGDAADVHFVSRYDAARLVVAREYDLVPVGRIDPRKYGMERPLQGGYLILVDRVAPWTRRKVQVPLPVERTGPQVLRLDLGHLSQHPRSHARVSFGGRLLDEHPRDGSNFYEVDVVRGAPARLTIESDAPLPSRPAAELQPAEKKITMAFDEGSGPKNRERLSASLRERPKLPYPSLLDRGRVTLPTISPQAAVFLVDLELDLPTAGAPYAQIIEAWVGSRRVYQGRRSVTAPSEDASDRARDVFTLSMTLTERDVRREETPLELRLRQNEERDGLFWLSVRKVSVRRVPLDDHYALDLDADRIAAALTRGFHPPHERLDEGAPPGRWTGRAASARLFLRDGPGPAVLEVVYWLGGRPRSAPRAKPEFSLLGRPLSGTELREERDGDTRVTARFEIPPALGLRPAEVLEIRTTPWVPREEGVSKDPRTLGIRIESISLRRLPARAG